MESEKNNDLESRKKQNSYLVTKMLIEEYNIQ
jgi:hypothetical protein